MVSQIGLYLIKTQVHYKVLYTKFFTTVNSTNRKIIVFDFSAYCIARWKQAIWLVN